MAEQWMSIVEYARTFAISDMTVRRRIKNGKLNAVLRDGKYYIQINPDHVSHESPDTEIRPLSPSPVSAPVMDMKAPSPYGVNKGGAVLSPRGWHQNQQESTSGIIANPVHQGDGVDIKGLVDYCNRSLSRIASIERHLNDTYQSKLARMEAELRSKDMEIAQLKQRVEDLQILIKMYDGSRT